MAAGGSPFCVNPGTYLFLVENVSGGVNKVDYVEFIYNDSPVETRSWGGIKSLFRDP